MKPFKFFPHETGQAQAPPPERELKSFFDEPVAKSQALESTPVPEEDLKEGLDLPVPKAKEEDPLLDELIRNHPNNIARRKYDLFEFIDFRDEFCSTSIASGEERMA